MRYMLLMQCTRADWQSLGVSPREDIEGYLGLMKGLDRQLRASGELVSDGGLGAPEHAKVVCARSGGAPRVTNAPFPDAGEFLARYWVVDCDSLGRVIEIAALVSAWPGRGGVPMNTPVEVRQVMRALGEEM